MKNYRAILMEVHDRVLGVEIYMVSQGLNTTAIKSITNLIETGNAKREYVERPMIVCLCGSTRFWKSFQEQSLRLTMDGIIVLSIGMATASDTEHLANGTITQSQKVAFDELHKRKIDVCDEILVLNVGGYIGDSTRSEIEYATELGKQINYLEP